ncbi:MAG: hypothetical protein KGS48_01455 [Bacteroidetes bacterium]|nr:hypothetical protein [Bacteroidota bacterium]
MNYFEFYSIPMSLSPDHDLLRKTYYAFSKKFHPDFHTQANAAEQEEMLELASQNNAAFKTLSEPDLCMRYVLELHGLLGSEENQAALPPAFLLEMMDLNEALMELEFNFDADRFQKTEKQATEILQNLHKSIESDLKIDLNGPDGQEALKKIRDFYLKKRYLLRIQENLRKFASA